MAPHRMASHRLAPTRRRGGRPGWRLAAVAGSLLALGSVLGTGALVLAQAPTASPAGPTSAPTEGAVAGPVDPRSSGEGPGLEAEPLLVLAGVLALGVAAAGGTLLYVRLTREE